MSVQLTTTGGPTVSLLTSSTTLGIEDMRQEFAGAVKTVEVYALRDPDLERLGWPSDEHMADIMGGWTNYDVQRAGKVLRSAFGVPHHPSRRPRSRALSPVGLATYLPQVASAFPERREVTLCALENVLLLAAELRVSCVEMVCGRVAERCRRSKNGEPCESVLYQHRQDPQYPPVKFELLKMGLKRLRDFAQNHIDDHPSCPPLAVALEVEPGPLYVLNNLHNAWEFLSATANGDYMIRHADDYYNFVGLNIDIGHMLICHHRRQHLLKELGIPGSRIYNFHISDNAELHFADLVPGMIHSMHPDAPGSFADWLRCFLCACKYAKNPIFRKNVSIELEGCASPQWAHQAIRNTKYLLAELARAHDVDIAACKDNCPVINF